MDNRACHEVSDGKKTSIKPKEPFEAEQEENEQSPALCRNSAEVHALLHPQHQSTWRRRRETPALSIIDGSESLRVALTDMLARAGHARAARRPSPSNTKVSRFTINTEAEQEVRRHTHTRRHLLN